MCAFNSPKAPRPIAAPAAPPPPDINDQLAPLSPISKKTKPVGVSNLRQDATTPRGVYSGLQINR